MVVVEPAHPSFPLTQTALSRLSLTPEFAYPDPYNARLLSARLQAPLPPFTPAEIAAVGLIGRIFIHLFQDHIQISVPSAFSELDLLLSSKLGENMTNQALTRFLAEFPPSPFYYAPEKAREYFIRADSADSRHGLYLSAFLVMLSNRNPALAHRDRVFSSQELSQSLPVQKMNHLILEYFKGRPDVVDSGKDIFEFLSEPFNKHPDSLADQLEFIRLHWSKYLSDTFLLTILRTLDIIKEETASRFFGQPAPEDPLLFSKASYLSGLDIVKFSDDLDWMPKLILIAKNVFVWLDQLSRHYQRPINHLSEIPDGELEKLASWGINGLWMIGLWERSPASQRIKQISGNIDAVPSAYSLFDYQIAEALGGEAAYRDLADRAATFNIRLAADMVPNHMGVYSKWIIEHPDWFLSLDNPPFPGYTFTGENLSHNPNVSIFIEDHYYDKTDAAVTFKHIDHLTGKERYIYHGNDGTAMPWNDTAQIDFLNPEAREAVIEAILHVARKFPVIRFDAAMTLAKKHVQRLWYPEPGSGGAIPTRSDHGMPGSDFDKLMPEEFWREVVDRVAIEAPDTLLLAEAFWMMEGYFVRSLGMHRVYNSAFMHMLRDEKNEDFRNLITETLEYDPQILKRYVNFMNNPDEETAIQQFGSDGKYFGTCAMMATLPGLPMLGHGQIEGLTEKYGMEYRRAYYDEQPNIDLIERHRREIFPLFHKRNIFADVNDFYLFDFVSDHGSIDQNVFAFSNRSGDDRALVIFHNKWGESTGRLHFTTPINGSSTDLVSALGLVPTTKDYVLFRDAITGHEYLLSHTDMQQSGLQFHLGAFHYMVFLDFHLADDPDGRLGFLAKDLAGRGTQSIQASLEKLKFEFFAETIISITDYLVATTRSGTVKKGQFFSDFEALINKISGSTRENATSFSYLPQFDHIEPEPYFQLVDYFQQSSGPETEVLPLAYISAICANLTLSDEDYEALAGVLSGKLVLISNAGLESGYLKSCLFALSILINSPSPGVSLFELVELWFETPSLRDFLQINDHDGKTWFNQESSLDLLDLSVAALFFSSSHPEKNIVKKMVSSRSVIIETILESTFEVEKFLEMLGKAKSHGSI